MSSAQEVLFIRLCIQFSSITLVFYDYALTWTREVRYFWMRNRQQTMRTRKFQFRFPFISLSTALYIACRYAMISNVLYAVALSGGLKSLGGVSCDTGYQICASFSVIGRAAIIAVWGIRTYAMFNRHILILILFGGMGSLIVTMDAVHVKYVVCGGGRGSQIAESLLAIFMVVYEVLVAMFTSVRAWQAMRVWKEIGGYSSVYGSGSGSAGEASNKGKGKAKSDDEESEEEERMEEERREMKRMRKYDLEWLCVKQGILYFCFVSMFTLGALITLNIAPNGSFIQRLLNAFTLPISGIMTSRFLLHLRQWEHRATHSSVTDGADEDDEDDIEFNASSNSGSRVRGGPLKFAAPSRQSLDSDLEVNDLGSKHGHYKYSEYDEDEDEDGGDLHKPTHPASEPDLKPERPKRSRSWSDSIIEEFGCDPVGRAVSVRERRGSRNGNDKGKGKCVAVDIDLDLERNNSEVNEDDR